MEELKRANKEGLLLSFSESPVPLEFTPVLGILVGVVITLFAVACVIILVLRVKYRNGNGKRSNGGKKVMVFESGSQDQGPTEESEEEMCLKPQDRGTESAFRGRLLRGCCYSLQSPPQ